MVIILLATVGAHGCSLQLCLLDSLYINFDQFDNFVESHFNEFELSKTEYRFSLVFSLDGGKYANNLAVENRAAEWVSEARCDEVLLIDNDGCDLLGAGNISQFSPILKYANLSHLMTYRDEYVL